ncbi:MAD2 mitotic arrest deficient-like 2 [Podila humilis]|nr:MAD2 mitotic arrest deficient-like 2 [Podila humilis]
MELALPDVLSEFLEVAIHMILYVRGIYPPELFESTQKYNCPLKTSRHPELIAYIQQIAQAIRTELQKDTIHRICVVTLDSSRRAVDRFVFETSALRPFHSHQQHRAPMVVENDVAATRKRLDKGKGKAIDNNNGDDEYPTRREYMDLDPGFEGNGLNDENLEQQDKNVVKSNDDGGADDDGDESPLRKMRPGEQAKPAAMNNRGTRGHLSYQALSMAHGSGAADAKVNGTVLLTADVETMLRAMLLKISICDAYLPPLDHDCSFTVLVEMKDRGTGPDCKADFPWAPVSANSERDYGKISAPVDEEGPKRRIIPVKTIEIADLQLELYIEQLPQ